MNELLAAAKAVIERWGAHHVVVDGTLIADLRAAVEQAENPPADYSEWTAKNSGKVLSAYEVWTAAKQVAQLAERERLKEIVGELLDPTDPWIHYSTLLDRIDGPDDDSGEE